MKVIGEVRFEEVLAGYLRDHPLDAAHPANSNQDGLDNLERAQQLFGCWTWVRLNRAEMARVMLPWHLSEGGDRELVPPPGLSVAQATDRLRKCGAELSVANPVCSAKIAKLGRSAVGPVHLSVGPVEHPDYAALRVRDALTHLDGLHRMIGWELFGRLSVNDGLEAFVAGDVAAVSLGRGTASSSASP